MRRVSCKAGNWLSAEDYVGSPESMMACTNCGDEFNFGPAVIALTDGEDPPLNDAVLPKLAWVPGNHRSEMAPRKEAVGR